MNALFGIGSMIRSFCVKGNATDLKYYIVAQNEPLVVCIRSKSLRTKTHAIFFPSGHSRAKSNSVALPDRLFSLSS
jgi:hypothetical protein